jgi:hypothetical protein
VTDVSRVAQFVRIFNGGWRSALVEQDQSPADRDHDMRLAARDRLDDYDPSKANGSGAEHPKAVLTTSEGKDPSWKLP